MDHLPKMKVTKKSARRQGGPGPGRGPHSGGPRRDPHGGGPRRGPHSGGPRRGSHGGGPRRGPHGGGPRPPRPRHRRHYRGGSSNPISTLLACLIVFGLAFAAWYFFGR